MRNSRPPFQILAEIFWSLTHDHHDAIATMYGAPFRWRPEGGDGDDTNEVTDHCWTFGAQCRIGGSHPAWAGSTGGQPNGIGGRSRRRHRARRRVLPHPVERRQDRKSTRLNSSHSQISYAVFCLKKKKKNTKHTQIQNLSNKVKIKNSINLYD